ncbi:MAG: HAD hydrolase-like protein [Holosporaceae bacterium]|jgi:HAD superfamily hydrolase (TIGR01450 family)|nr:HAD hydrolase-like protein [Holosporaceae bacterium]
MEIEGGIMSVTERYDALFVDIFGVLFDGAALYERVLQTLEKLRRNGKKIIILSNSTQISEDAKVGYSQKGMVEGVHYDRFITSGEFLRHVIVNQREEFSKRMGMDAQTVKCIFMGNSGIFQGSHLKKTDDYESADFLYLGVPRISYGAVRMDDVLDESNKPVSLEDVLHSDWHKLKDSQGRRGFSEFAHQLEICLEKNKVLLAANPDIFSPGTLDHTRFRYPIVTQGCIGAYYEKLGGKVVYFGKPFREIFEYAKTMTGGLPDEKIAMIGDTPWTDIVGANAAGISSIMVLTGIPTEFFDRMPRSMTIDEKLDRLLDKIAPKIAKINGSLKPNHVLRRFSQS